MEKVRVSLNDQLFEGVKDDALAMARKWHKENSPEFKKLMVMLDKDRGLMVPFTKWLLGIPSKEAIKAAGGQAKPGRFGMRKRPTRRPEDLNPGEVDPEIEMPRFIPLERMRPVPIEDLEHLYNQAKEFGLQNIKRDFNSFKNAEEFGDYLTAQLGDKHVRDALNMTTFNENTKKHAGIVHQVKEMIINTPQIYNLFRNNKEHALTLAEFVARKGARYHTPDALFNAISAKLSELDDFNRQSVVEKIKKFNLKAHVVQEVPWGARENNVLLVYVEDVTACANLGSQEWCIAQAEGFGFGHEKDAASKGNIHKLKKPTSTAQSHFNNTYQLSKYKKCYILFDFSRDADDYLRKICFIVDPGGEINGGWDAKDTAINSGSYGMSAEQLVLREYPELNS